MSVTRSSGSPGTDAGPITARGTNAVNALIHLYRAEVGRMTAYRRRLDTTTNWAVTSTALVASFAFDRPEHSHASFLFLMFVIYFFLHLEARRFRAYEASRHRVRLIERHFYAEMLGKPVAADWLNRLNSALRYFYSPATGHWTALGWRLRGGYAWIYGAVLAAWLVKLDIISRPLTGIVTSAQLGSIPGWLVLAVVSAFYAWLVFLTVHARGDAFGDDEAETTAAGLVATDTQLDGS